MRTLCFTQITDDRFDKNITSLLEERVQKIKELLNIDGIKLFVSDIENIDFKSNNQCRCRFQVVKTTRKISWNDIYKLVNSVNPALYRFG